MNVDDYLTAPFKQSWILKEAIKAKPSLNGTNASQGICQELCWKWLKRISAKPVKYDSPISRMGSLTLDKTVDNAIARHNTANLLTHTHEQYHLENVECYFGYRREVQSKWRVRGGGLYFSFTCPRYGGGKHAIAAYIPRVPGRRQTHSAALAFEPNKGEFNMNAGMFPIWLRETLRSYGGTEKNITEIRFLNA
ncbi:MAG: hypothetical protein KUG77_10160 [Nannocystaceae bacterium]|nr:hypothetical protein [Nannocystaceae bacterium]